MCEISHVYAAMHFAPIQICVGQPHFGSLCFLHECIRSFFMCDETFIIIIVFFLRKVIWIGRSIRSTYKMRDKSNNKMHRKQINREHSQQIALTIFHTIPQSLSLSVHLLNATYHDLCIPRHSSFSPSINPKQFLILFCVDNREIHFNRINLQRSTELLFFSFFFLFSWTNKKNFVLFFIRFGLSILCSYCVSIRIIFVQWYREWADKIYR